MEERMNNEEEWRPVVGHEKFEVSNFGRIRNAISKRIRKQQNDKDGYKTSSMDGTTVRVHRAVAMAFIPNPNNYPVVNHLDEVKWNNYYKNLEWCTVAMNNNYGTHNQRVSESKSYEVDQFDMDGNKLGSFKSTLDAGAACGNIDGSVIASCCRGDILSAYGYKWRYADVNRQYNVRRDPKVKKPVDQYTRGLEFVCSFDSIKEASDATGLFEQSIGACCRGKIKHTGGYVFKYHDKDADCSGTRTVADYCKKVNQYTLDGQLIRTFESITKAATSCGINGRRNHIRSCCLGTRNQCGGYKWSYAQ